MSRLTAQQRFMFNIKFKKFLENYGHLYSPDELEYIDGRFLGNFFEKGINIDIMNEIYQEIGVYDIVTDNINTKFYNKLSSEYDINQRLLEVGCGLIPSFAKMLKSKQSSGSITVIDPRVRLASVDDITIIRTYFDFDFDLTDFDLVYGIEPCDATPKVIEYANKADKDLCVLMCKCVHYIPTKGLDEFDATYKDWLEYIEEVMKTTLPEDREYKMEYLEDIDTPLFTTKKLTTNK